MTMRIPENRDLTSEERTLLTWLLGGDPRGKAFLDMVEGVWVVGHCTCGCPTITLAPRGAAKWTNPISTVVASVFGTSPEGIPVGVIVHVREGVLSELEVYSRTGDKPISLPRIEDLVP